MKFWVTCAWCLAALCLHAQQAEEADKAQLKMDEKITVTAEKQAVSVKDTPASVTVVDAEEIAKRGVHDIQDLLRFDPSITMDFDNSRLGPGGFNIRGIGGNRVLTQIDGAPVVDGFAFGPLETPRFHLDPSILKTVEVVKGPGSALYGSDAMAGVVSFVTKDPVDILGLEESFAGDVRAQYDERQNATSTTANMAFDFGRQKLLVSAGLRDYENQETQGSLETADASRTVPNPVDATSLNLLLKGTHQFSQSSHLKLTYERFENDADVSVLSGQGTSVIFGVPTQVTDYTAKDVQTRDRFGLEQEWSLLSTALADRVKASLYFQTSENDQFTSELRSSPASSFVREGMMLFEQEDTGIEVEASKSWETTDMNLRLTYGLEFEYHTFEQERGREERDMSGNVITGPGYPTRYFPPTDVDETGIYAQLEMLMFDDRLRLVPGVRFDRFELEPDTSDAIFSEITSEVSNLEDEAVSPKLGFRFDLGSGFALAGQVAEGFRAPNYSSVNSGFTNLQSGYQTLPNPDLEPESSTNYEGGIRFNRQRFNAHVTYFENRYRDFIQDTLFVGVSPQGISLFQSQNIDRVNIEGWELQTAFRLNSDWTISAAWSDIEGRDLEADAELSNLEPSGGNVNVLFDRGAFDARLSLSLRESKDAPEGQFSPDAYEVMDLWFGYTFRRDLRLLLSVYNLTDETYYPWSYVRGQAADSQVIERYSAPGRSASFSIQFKF